MKPGSLYASSCGGNDAWLYVIVAIEHGANRCYLIHNLGHNWAASLFRTTDLIA